MAETKEQKVEWLTVVVVPELALAEMFKDVLAKEGIVSALQSVAGYYADPVVLGPAGPYAVLVSPGDFEASKAILAAMMTKVDTGDGV